MKKEYFFIAAFGLFILAYTLDYFAGPITLGIRQPYAFLHQSVLSSYPLTAVALATRAAGILITALLAFTLVENHYLPKTLILLVSGILMQLYAIQQLATGMQTTTIQWTLSICAAGLLFILPVGYFLIMAIIVAFFKRPADTTTLHD